MLYANALNMEKSKILLSSKALTVSQKIGSMFLKLKKTLGGKEKIQVTGIFSGLVNHNIMWLRVKRVLNMVGKGENAGFQLYLLFMPPH